MKPSFVPNPTTYAQILSRNILLHHHPEDIGIFLFSVGDKDCKSWKMEVLRFFGKMGKVYDTFIHVRRGDDSPKNVFLGKVVFAGVVVGEEWLASNLSEKHWAQYVAERMLR